ncbi:hypothetical protein P154DRAFT_354224 [Amniculicola lignicola CBS 123094]|uniref:Uncharacterized protein n=1 Tax=Amniculicola lignicola CBS 123094 TaxID=1392246 RepID=A0A6A5WWS2_9PLEO|nr:hypothetical protein P154DRAFT_354224 [Amniculicola lignicola CBS 123094]
MTTDGRREWQALAAVKGSFAPAVPSFWSLSRKQKQARIVSALHAASVDARQGSELQVASCCRHHRHTNPAIFSLPDRPGTRSDCFTPPIGPIDVKLARKRPGKSRLVLWSALVLSPPTASRFSSCHGLASYITACSARSTRRVQLTTSERRGLAAQPATQAPAVWRRVCFARRCALLPIRVARDTAALFFRTSHVAAQCNFTMRPGHV